MKKVIRVSESNLVKLIQKVLVEEKHINPKKLNEQADLGYDIATIMGELNRTNSDEQKIVDIVKKYTDKASFKQFVDQYKAKSGKDFGVDIYRAIQSNDVDELNDLKAHLKPMGITVTNKYDQKNRIGSYVFDGLDTPAAPAAAGNTREQNLFIMYTSVGKDGIIHAPGSVNDNMKWSDYVSSFKVTQDELNKLKSNPYIKTDFHKSSKVVNKPKGNLKPKVVRNYTTMLAEI